MTFRQWMCPHCLVRGALSLWLGLTLSLPPHALALRGVGLEEGNARDDLAAALTVPSSARPPAPPGLARASLEQFEAVEQALREGSFQLSLQPEPARQAWNALTETIQNTLSRHLVTGDSLPVIAAARSVSLRVINREFAQGYQALAATAVQPTDRRRRQPWQLTRRQVLGGMLKLAAAALAPPSPGGAVRTTLAAAPATIGPDDVVNRFAALFEHNPVALMLFQQRADALASRVQRIVDRANAASYVPKLFTDLLNRQYERSFAQLVEAVHWGRSSPEARARDAARPFVDQVSLPDRYRVAMHYVVTEMIRAGRGLPDDRRARLQEALAQIEHALKGIARIQPATGMRLRRFLRNPAAEALNPTVLDSIRNEQIVWDIRRALTGELSLPANWFAGMLGEAPELGQAGFAGALEDNEAALSDIEWEISADWRSFIQKNRELMEDLDLAADGIRSPEKMAADLRSVGDSLDRLHAAYGQLPGDLQGLLSPQAERLAELSEFYPRVYQQVARRTAGEPREPPQASDQPLALVPMPWGPLAQRIAAQAATAPPVTLTVEFDDDGVLGLAALAGERTEGLDREARLAMQQLLPPALRQGTTWRWTFDRPVSPDEVGQRLAAPWQFARRVGPGGMSGRALREAVEPTRVVVMESTVVDGMPGMGEAVGAMQAAGLHSQLLIVPADASPEFLDAVVVGLSRVRERAGALQVTLYGASESRVVGRLRARLAAAGIQGVQAKPPTDLHAFLRDLFLHLGVPETVATPEAVQQWLTAAGLEAAA